MATQTTPRAELGDAQPPLPPRMGDPRRLNRDVPATKGRDRSLPIPGHPDPNPMDEQPARITSTNDMNLWRAGCAETCQSGSEGGPRKRTGGNTGTAPRSDPYTRGRRFVTYRVGEEMQPGNHTAGLPSRATLTELRAAFEAARSRRSPSPAVRRLRPGPKWITARAHRRIRARRFSRPRASADAGRAARPRCSRRASR